MYMNAYTIISGFLMQIAAMIGMGYMSYKVANTYESESLRLGYLKALSFCMGYLVGPLMHHLAEFEPMILVQEKILPLPWRNHHDHDILHVLVQNHGLDVRI